MGSYFSQNRALTLKEQVSAWWTEKYSKKLPPPFKSVLSILGDNVDVTKGVNETLDLVLKDTFSLENGSVEFVQVEEGRLIPEFFTKLVQAVFGAVSKKFQGSEKIKVSFSIQKESSTFYKIELKIDLAIKSGEGTGVVENVSLIASNSMAFGEVTTAGDGENGEFGVFIVFSLRIAKMLEALKIGELFRQSVSGVSVKLNDSETVKVTVKMDDECDSFLSLFSLQKLEKLTFSGGDTALVQFKSSTVNFDLKQVAVFYDFRKSWLEDVVLSVSGSGVLKMKNFDDIQAVMRVDFDGPKKKFVLHTQVKELTTVKITTSKEEEEGHIAKFQFHELGILLTVTASKFTSLEFTGVWELSGGLSCKVDGLVTEEQKGFCGKVEGEMNMNNLYEVIKSVSSSSSEGTQDLPPRAQFTMREVFVSYGAFEKGNTMRIGMAPSSTAIHRGLELRCRCDVDVKGWQKVELEEAVFRLLRIKNRTTTCDGYEIQLEGKVKGNPLQNVSSASVKDPRFSYSRSLLGDSGSHHRFEISGRFTINGEAFRRLFELHENDLKLRVDVDSKTTSTYFSIGGGGEEFKVFNLFTMKDASIQLQENTVGETNSNRRLEFKVSEFHYLPYVSIKQAKVVYYSLNDSGDGGNWNLEVDGQEIVLHFDDIFGKFDFDIEVKKLVYKKKDEMNSDIHLELSSTVPFDVFGKKMELCDARMSFSNVQGERAVTFCGEVNRISAVSEPILKEFFKRANFSTTFVSPIEFFISFQTKLNVPEFDFLKFCWKDQTATLNAAIEYASSTFKVGTKSYEEGLNVSFDPNVDGFKIFARQDHLLSKADIIKKGSFNGWIVSCHYTSISHWRFSVSFLPSKVGGSDEEQKTLAFKAVTLTYDNTEKEGSLGIEAVLCLAKVIHQNLSLDLKGILSVGLHGFGAKISANVLDSKSVVKELEFYVGDLRISFGDEFRALLLLDWTLSPYGYGIDCSLALDRTRIDVLTYVDLINFHYVVHGKLQNLSLSRLYAIALKLLGKSKSTTEAKLAEADEMLGRLLSIDYLELLLCVGTVKFGNTTYEDGFKFLCVSKVLGIESYITLEFSKERFKFEGIMKEFNLFNNAIAFKCGNAYQEIFKDGKPIEPPKVDKGDKSEMEKQLEEIYNAPGPCIQLDIEIGDWSDLSVLVKHSQLKLSGNIRIFKNVVNIDALVSSSRIFFSISCDLNFFGVVRKSDFEFDYNSLDNSLQVKGHADVKFSTAIGEVLDSWIRKLGTTDGEKSLEDKLQEFEESEKFYGDEGEVEKETKEVDPKEQPHIHPIFCRRGYDYRGSDVDYFKHLLGKKLERKKSEVDGGEDESSKPKEKRVKRVRGIRKLLRSVYKGLKEIVKLILKCAAHVASFIMRMMSKIFEVHSVDFDASVNKDKNSLMIFARVKLMVLGKLYDLGGRLEFNPYRISTFFRSLLDAFKEKVKRVLFGKVKSDRRKAYLPRSIAYSIEMDKVYNVVCEKFNDDYKKPVYRMPMTYPPEMASPAKNFEPRVIGPENGSSNCLVIQSTAKTEESGNKILLESQKHEGRTCWKVRIGDKFLSGNAEEGESWRLVPESSVEETTANIDLLFDVDVVYIDDRGDSTAWSFRNVASELVMGVAEEKVLVGQKIVGYKISDENDLMKKDHCHWFLIDFEERKRPNFVPRGVVDEIIGDTYHLVCFKMNGDLEPPLPEYGDQCRTLQRNDEIDGRFVRKERGRKKDVIRVVTKKSDDVNSEGHLQSLQNFAEFQNCRSKFVFSLKCEICFEKVLVNENETSSSDCLWMIRLRNSNDPKTYLAGTLPSGKEFNKKHYWRFVDISTMENPKQNKSILFSISRIYDDPPVFTIQNKMSERFMGLEKRKVCEGYRIRGLELDYSEIGQGNYDCMWLVLKSI